MKHLNRLVTVIIVVLAVSAGLFAGDGPVLKDEPAYWYAAMDFQGSYKKFPANMMKFMQVFFQQGVKPNGPPMGVYYNNPEEVKEADLKWAIAFPVPKDANIKPPLKKIEFAAQKVVTCVHMGPYEKMKPTFDKIEKFMQESGFEMVGLVIEKYMNDPRQVKPEEIKTIIIIPVKKK